MRAQAQTPTPPSPQLPLVRFGDAGGLRVVERWDAPGVRRPWHVNDRAALTCVLQGGIEESLRSGSIECAKRAVLFKPPGELHSNCAGPAGARSLAIELPEQRQLGHATTALNTVRRVHSVQTDALVSLLLSELRTGDVCAALAIEGLVLELLAAVGRTAPAAAMAARPAWLDGALEELRARFREPLPIVEAASAAGVTPTHLARVLWRHEGSTPSEYLRRLRIEYAKIQLLRTDQPLAAIAVDSGFADQSHFTRTFARVEGVTPGRFRRRRSGAA